MQLAEAIGGTRVRAEHLLGQLRSVGHLGRALAPIKTSAPAPTSSRATVLEGVTAQIHDTMVSQHHAGALDTQHRYILVPGSPFRTRNWMLDSMVKLFVMYDRCYMVYCLY